MKKILQLTFLVLMTTTIGMSLGTIVSAQPLSSACCNQGAEYTENGHPYCDARRGYSCDINGGAGSSIRCKIVV